jgi:SAM-dependent methyltransferase
MTGTVFTGSSDAYDRFMGRYSRQLARAFADFAGIAAGMHVLDVGAGTGALSDEVIARGATVSAVEPSDDYATGLRERIEEVHVAPAEEIPLPDGTFDAVLAQLVVRLPQRRRRRGPRDGTCRSGGRCRRDLHVGGAGNGHDERAQRDARPGRAGHVPRARDPVSGRGVSARTSSQGPG